MQRSLLSKSSSSVCYSKSHVKSFLRKHTKCASTNFHLSSSAPNSPRTDLSVLSSLDTRNRFSSFLVVVFLLLSSSSPKTLCILRNTINHTHSYDVLLFFRKFFFLSPLSSKIPYKSSMMMKKRTTKTRTKKVCSFITHQKIQSKNA